MDKVGVVGAGTMGAAIAALFVNADYDVVLVDVSEEALKRARERHEGECIEELEEAGIKKRDEIVSKIKYTTDLNEVKDCFFVVEAIKERLEPKRELVKKLEEVVADDCIIATNTSSFKPSEIAEVMRNPERLTLFHFSNPPILMELVEVGGERVDKVVLEKTIEIARKIGKKAFVIRKECRGHILNRMLGASGVGASYALYNAMPEEIDAAIKNLGMPRGVFELFDLIGVDICVDVLDSFKEVYGDKFEPPKGMRFFLYKMVEWGKLGKKSGEGFYKWVEGKPVMPEAEPGDVMPIVAAVVNEAFKIVEEGFGDKETVNEIYKAATGSYAGVFDVVELLGHKTILNALGELYEKTGREVFRAANNLKGYQQPSGENYM